MRARRVRLGLRPVDIERLAGELGETMTRRTLDQIEHDSPRNREPTVAKLVRILDHAEAQQSDAAPAGPQRMARFDIIEHGDLKIVVEWPVNNVDELVEAVERLRARENERNRDESDT